MQASEDPTSDKYPDREFFQGRWRTPEQIEKRRATDKKKRDRADYMRAWRMTPAGREHERRANIRRNARRKQNPSIGLRDKLKHRYGLSLDDYHRMLREQGGACAICGRSGHTQHRLHVDHDHETGGVRELLCAPCNLALGYMGDCIDRAEALVAYIRKWKP